MTPALLTRREFAQRASLSVRQLTALERRGVLRVTRFNQRVIRIAESELAALPTRIRVTRAETPATIERGLEAHLGKGWREQC